ncbi:hypothetical protein [Allgaiera indica]|uniref:hypothetical protein n=1 Tax=Allgaiera indica TaxID=765699 RepID=UPI001AECAD3C|nr:hypothetical protein [Allgaiera indica]
MPGAKATPLGESGSAVVASALIAHRARNTLVLVPRRELLSQWVERLGSFLQIDPKQVGTIGAGKRKPTGVVDVALIQSLVRKGAVDDVLKSLEAKRSPIVLTERKDHLEYLQQRFSRFAKNIVVLRGGMSAKDRKVAHAALNVADDKERLILATGRYIGEGFDDARLDALFLTMPIAWKGTLAQYVVRLHRRHDKKKDVLVVDYVDSSVPVIARMAAKRRSGYRGLGYVME